MTETLEVTGDVSDQCYISIFYGDGSNFTNVGALTVKEEGSDVTTEATSINFVGAFVTASAAGGCNSYS